VEIDTPDGDSAATVHTDFGAAIMDGSLVQGDLETGDNYQIDFSYDETPNEWTITPVGDEDTWDLTATDDDETRSNWGSTLVVDEESFDITHPIAQVQAHHALGAVAEGESAGSYTAVDLDANGNLPNMATLDDEVVESTKENNHLILVGGPAVNDLVAELADAGETRSLEVWQTYAEGDALIQIVENAFADDRHALVVAGYEADDTRAAARYISQYRANADTLADYDTTLELTSAQYPSER
jgi:S-layer protein (TIGR01564 family)